MSEGRYVRIGGGSAFFADSALAVPQLLQANVEYIILDYLAEGAMGLFGRMRLDHPDGGYPSDLLDVHIGPFLTEIASRRVRIITNAGGVNPAGLAGALRKLIVAQGLRLQVACVEGDDLSGRLREFSDVTDMETGAAFPIRGVTSANAYLGAFPIAEALKNRADIVITGRVVDSALTLGPLIHEFGWDRQDFDRLAGGTVAGHLIECGPQVTGGTFTDWRDVKGWENIGSPIAECYEDGSCVITKSEGTGGLVSFGTVAEQLLYEVGDPQAYFVPDVTCDFTTVQLEHVGENRIRVSGATGYPPTDAFKACVTWDDGWRAVAYQPIIGGNVHDKAEKQAAALFERGRTLLRGRNFGDWRRTEMVLIGDGNAAVAKLVVEHDNMLACQMFAREQLSAISAMAPGTSIGFGTQIQPCMHLLSFLLPKADVKVTIDGVPFDGPLVSGFDPAMIKRPSRDHVVPVAPTEVASGMERPDISMLRPPPGPKRFSLFLQRLAYARSGEKGETINIGVIAREAVYWDKLRAALTPYAIKKWLPDLGDYSVEIFDVPGIYAVNVVLKGALPGGINASQRLDPAAKGIAQRMMRFPVPV